MADDVGVGVWPLPHACVCMQWGGIEIKSLDVCRVWTDALPAKTFTSARHTFNNKVILKPALSIISPSSQHSQISSCPIEDRAHPTCFGSFNTSFNSHLPCNEHFLITVKVGRDEFLWMTWAVSTMPNAIYFTADADQVEQLHNKIRIFTKSENLLIKNA